MKTITYSCDVCGATSTKPFKLHMTAMIGKESTYADICSRECVVRFAEAASTKAGLEFAPRRSTDEL